MLTIEGYKKKKKEGLIVWDTASMNKTASNYNDFATNYSNQRNYQGERWSDEEFNNQRDNAKGLRDDIQYMEAYANSIKNDDPETYNNIQDILKTVNGGLDEADSWFDQYSDPNKRARYYDQVTNMRREREKQRNEYFQDAAKLAAVEEYSKSKSENPMENMQRAHAIAAKYGMTDIELQKAESEYSEQQKQIKADTERVKKYANKSAAKLAAIAEYSKSKSENPMENMQRAHAIAAKYGMTDIELQKAESEYSERQKQIKADTEPEKKYANKSFDELSSIIKLEVPGVGANSLKKSFSDEDIDYIVDRLVETGDAKQLDNLSKSLPNTDEYKPIKEKIDKAIATDYSGAYYEKVLANDVKAATIVQKYYAVQNGLLKVKSDGTVGYDGDGKENVELDTYTEGNTRTKIDDKKEEILSQWEELKNKGYDTDKLYKSYQRYYEHNRELKINEEMSKWAKENPVLASLAAIPMNTIGSPMDVIKYLSANIDKASGGDGYIDPATTFNKKAETIRSTVAEEIGEATGTEFWSFAYEWLNSMAESGAGMGLNQIPGIGKALSVTMFFSTAGVSAANRVIENGGSLEEATGTMVAYGLAETLAEEFSLDRLKIMRTAGTKSVKEFVKNLFKQMFTEGSEEVATSIAQGIADTAINRDKSEINLSIKKYMEEGKSEEEAKRLASSDFWLGVAGDFLGGAASGGIFGAATSGISLHSYKKSKSNTTVDLGGVKLSAKDAQEKSREYYHDIAQKITDSGKTDVINGLIEDAKSGGKKSKALANSIEQTIKEKGSSAVRAADVENLLITLYDENVDAHITGENIGSAVAVYKLEKKVTGEVGASQLKMYNSNFNDAGAKFGSEAAKSNPNAFGNTFKNGVSATDKDGNKVIIKSIDSSVKEYGSDDRTVVLKTADGNTVNADEVTIDNADFERLVNLAGTYDTLGARALLANFEEAQANGVSIDDYIEHFEALYKIGRSGVTFENANKSAEFKSIINSVGENVAQNAMNAGNYDAEGQIELENALHRRVRVGNAKTSANSRVFTADSGVKIKGDESFIAVMNNIANAIDCDIVLTDRLRKGDRGVYSKGRIYISSELDVHVIAAVALHEAVHHARVYAPAEFRALEKFVMNYLVSTGQDVKTQLDNIASIWGQDAKSREAQIEELVANTVMSLASDEKAFTKAVNLEENKNLFNKVKEAIKNIVARIKEWFKTVDESGVVSGHNMQAQPWLGDVQALEQLAQKFNELTTAAKHNKAEFGERESEEKKSFAGKNAQTSSNSALDRAKQMERDGRTSEEIRQNTGWHKGYDGKWRFEIDDSKMTIKEPVMRGGRIGDLISHDVLFAAYPQLKNLLYEFDDLKAGVRGYMPADGRGVFLDNSLRRDVKELRKTLSHEIQHYIQKIEGFSKGSSPEHFAAKYPVSKLEIENKKKIKSILNGLDNNTANKYYRYKDLGWAIDKMIEADAFPTDGNKLLQLEKLSDEHDDLYTEFYGEEWFSEISKLERQIRNPAEFYRSLYYNTAGEIEARDTATRLDLNAEQRKEKRPDIDRDGVVFADGDNSEIEGKSSKDDAFYFDDEGELTIISSDEGYDVKEVDTKQLLKNSTPDAAIFMIQQRMAQTAQRIIADSPNVKLDEKDRLAIAQRIMNSYGIVRKNNAGLDKQIADRIERFISDIVESPKSSFSTHFNSLAIDCRKFLENSGKYERGYLQKTAEKVKSLLRGKTLILPSNVASYILPDYDNSISNIRRSYGGYIGVAFESDKKSVKNPVYMDELMHQIANVQEVKALFENGATPDSYEGWGFLDNLINNVLQPKFSNPYYNNVYESIDDTATEMAAAIAAAVVDEKAGKGVTMKKLDAQSVKALALGRKKMLAENKALHEVKYEKYRKAKQIDKYFISFEKTNYRREYQERTKKTQYMRQLGRKLNSLTKRLDGKAPKNEYIPEILKKPLLNVLQMFQADPGKNKDGTSKRVPSYFGAFRNLTEVSQRVNELANAYSKLEGTESSKGNNEFLDFDINALVFNKGVLNELKDVAEFIQGKNVYQMDSNDLKIVLEVINDLDNSLKNAVQIIVDGKKTTIQEAADKGIEQTNNVYFSKDGKLFLTTALREARNKFVATSLDPLRYGRMLSGYKEDGIMYQLLSDLHCGEQKKIRIMQQAYTPLQNIMERHKRGELVSVQRKAVEEFTMKDINTGEDVELSQGMLMSIYLTNKQADGHRHLINEKGDNYYTRVPDLEYLNKNRFLPDVQGNNLKAKGEKSHEIRLSKNDLERISEYIESNSLLKDLASEMHNTFNGLLSDEINKVSMQRQGRMIATVKDYFPIQVDKDDPKKKFDINFEGEGIFTDNRLKSRSFTKQRTKSWTAIVIDDALSVFQRHVNEVAEYCGMTIAVENIQKVIASDNGKITMRKAIENKFGQSALHYLNKLLGDIQKRKDNTDENALTRATGHAMGAALAFNPRSALKNWAALPLANMYFGTNNVAKATFVGLSKQGNKLVEKYSKYTPYMWYRAQGNGTVVGELSRQHGLYGRFAEKLDIMSWADQKVVNSLLYAAEQHVKKTTDLAFDSEEFKQEVARQFEKCVDESQPNSMITSKPQFVRNNVMRVLSLNAFASQRMAMGNGIIDSFMEYSARRHEYHLDKNAENKKAKNEAKKKFARKFFGVIESGLLQALLGTLASVLIYHKWDDYKDKDGNVTLQSFGAGLGFNVLKNAPEEILGGFVWLDKIYGVVEKLIDKEAYGADFSVMSFSAVEDISTAIKNGNYAKAWGRGMDLLGIPIAFGTNIQRLLQSGSSYVKDIENWKLGFTNNKGEVDYSYMHIQIAHAYENGDSENARWLSELWSNSGKKEEGRNEKLAEALATENEDIIDAAISRQNGDLTRHNDVKNKYINMGLSEKLFDKAITKVINKAKKDVEDQKFDTTDDAVQYLVSQGFNESAALKLVEIRNDDSSGNKKAKSEYSYKEAFTSLSSGNADSYELAKQSIAEKLVADGEAEDLEEAGEKVDKKMKGFQYTKSLFEDYHSVRGEKFSTAREKLLRIYGSEDELKKKYEEFVKKYIN